MHGNFNKLVFVLPIRFLAFATFDPFLMIYPLNAVQFSLHCVASAMQIHVMPSHFLWIICKVIAYITTIHKFWMDNYCELWWSNLTFLFGRYGHFFLSLACANLICTSLFGQFHFICVILKKKEHKYAMVAMGESISTKKIEHNWFIVNDNRERESTREREGCREWNVKLFD